MSRYFWKSIVAPIAVVALAGCEDGAAAQDPLAADELGKLLPLATQSVDSIRAGLPDAAGKLASMLDVDPGSDLASLQRALRVTTAAIPNQPDVRPTFSIFLDPQGVALRSDVDPDNAAGRTLLTAFPALKGSLSGGSQLMDAHGAMDELAVVNAKNDAQYLLAYPVTAAGTPRGAMVIGWSLRHVAHALEDLGRRRHDEIAAKEAKKAPVLYVMLVVQGQVYPSLLAPDVAIAAARSLDISAKVQAGAYRTSMPVGERTFGVAAEKLPAFGPDAAVIVFFSAI